MAFCLFPDALENHQIDKYLGQVFNIIIFQTLIGITNHFFPLKTKIILDFQPLKIFKNLNAWCDGMDSLLDCDYEALNDIRGKKAICFS